MELAPRDSDVITGMSNIQETIIVILATDETCASEIAMIDPDPSGFVKSDEITAGSSNIEPQVTKDDIALLPDAEATTVAETRVGADTENRSVAEKIDNTTTAEHAADTDDAASGDGSPESRAGRDGSA